MKRFCIVGRNISYTMSPALHTLFAKNGSTIPYPFDVQDIADDEGLRAFVTHAKNRYAGFNVTIPYKETVYALLDRVSNTTSRLKNANVVEINDGKLIGHNTDIHGFLGTLKRNEIDPNGKLCAVLGGTGGVGKTISAALSDLGGEVIVVSRNIEKAKDEILRGGLCATPTDYSNIPKNIQILCNATPVGTEDKGTAPISLDGFEALEYVFDAVYRPYDTKLLSEARERGIANSNGLYMLFYQGYSARRIWGERKFSEEELASLFRRFEQEYLRSQVKQCMADTVFLTGFMGAGKSSVGRCLAELSGYTFLDLDEEIERRHGSITKLFAAQGEKAFRKLEENVLRELPLNKTVVSLGGGTVINNNNYNYMKKMGKIVYLQGESGILYERVKGTNRPLVAEEERFKVLYKTREPIYLARCDLALPPIDGVENKALEILRFFI